MHRIVPFYVRTHTCTHPPNQSTRTHRIVCCSMCVFVCYLRNDNDGLSSVCVCDVRVRWPAVDELCARCCGSRNKFVMREWATIYTVFGSVCVHARVCSGQLIKCMCARVLRKPHVMTAQTHTPTHGETKCKRFCGDRTDSVLGMCIHF